MLRITGGATSRPYCDGMTRRSFVQAGVLTAAGLTLPGWLQTRAAMRSAGKPLKDTAVILIWLDGGPTHLETYDPKPEAPAEYRGPLKAIATNVPGVLISELLPQHARVMDKLAIIRSMNHTTGDHYAGAHWMLTGYFGSNAARQDPMYPSAGSITAKLRGPNHPGMPAYVAVPVAASVGLVPGYNSAAYLGSAYNPFQTGGDPNDPHFNVRNLTLPGGLTLQQLEDRRALLQTFDRMRRDLDQSGLVETLDRFQIEAYELISGPRARQAFDISKEDPRLRDRYGRHTWGQSCLLARRLVEAGVTFVTVHMGGWDDHSGIEQAMKYKLPMLDSAVGALVEDLVVRGLWDKVAICVCGEFGRTPRINGSAGRDHWGELMSVLMGGGGLRGGVVVGSSTAKGEYPKDRPVGPEDMLATLYRILGIETTVHFTDKTGRPIPVLNKGEPIAELLA
ncbi:MAG: DUF1501 domain-containing protein [Gemmataceae bacterium]